MPTCIKILINKKYKLNKMKIKFQSLDFLVPQVLADFVHIKVEKLERLYNEVIWCKV